MVQFDKHTEKMREFDEKLTELERATHQVEEQRREYINQNGLNKPVKDGRYTKG